MVNTDTPTTDEERLERDDGWLLAVWGSAYAIVGFAGVYAAQHVGNPWRLLLKVLGFMLAGGGMLCLLWFFGLAILSGLEKIKHPKPIERAFVALGVLIASLALYLLSHA